MNSELQSLVAACRDPADRTARLVLADWLDDRGDPATAYALRWMVRHGRNPSPDRDRWRWYRRGFEDADPRFWVRNKRERRIPAGPSWLPEVIGREMPVVYARTWWSAVKKLGRAIARVKAMIDL